MGWSLYPRIKRNRPCFPNGPEAHPQLKGRFIQLQIPYLGLNPLWPDRFWNSAVFRFLIFQIYGPQRTPRQYPINKHINFSVAKHIHFQKSSEINKEYK